MRANGRSPRSSRRVSKRARNRRPASSDARERRSTREASTFSTNTNATTTCVWYLPRKPTSPPSAAIPTISNFPAGRSISRCCEPTRTTSPPSRLQPRAQREFDRDMPLPITLMRAAELRGRFIQFGTTTPADDRIVQAPLNSLQNAIKVRRKELDALNDGALLASKSQAEERLRAGAHITGTDPWHEIESASARERALYLQYTFLESGAGFNSGLFRDARLLVRGADERMKRNIDRLREFTDASLPLIQRELYTRVPVYQELEVLTLSFSLERMREWLGPDHPVVRKLLSKESPESLATRLIAETKIDDAEVRRQLWQGGKAAVAASLDPMIAFARAVDADARTLRKRYEDEVEAPTADAGPR